MYIISLIITLVLSFTWPFQSTDHRIHRGYGDFNGIAGFHPGIDVYSPSDIELVCTPYSNAYVWKTIQNPENGEWALLLTESIPETMGLMYQHLLPENPAEPFFETQILGNTIGTCIDPSGLSGVRHVHIANFLKADWPAQGLPPQAGYSDVLASFSIPVHYASFAPVLQASNPLSGIGFWPEGVPLALDILRGAVNFRNGVVG